MKSKRSKAWQKRQLVKRIAEKLSNKPQRHIVSYEELEASCISALKSADPDVEVLTPSQKP